MHQVRAAVHQGFDVAVVVGAGAFDHVTGQRPGAAGKADQRYPAIQRLANGSDRVEHVAQLVHVRHRQFGHGSFVAHVFGEARPFADGKAQAQAHGVGHGEDVAEQDGCVQRVTLQRLQRDFRGEVHVGGQAHEAARFRTRSAVLRQVTPGLAHQPDRRVVRGLAHAGTQKAVIQGGSEGAVRHGAMLSGEPSGRVGGNPRLTR